MSSSTFRLQRKLPLPQKIGLIRLLSAFAAAVFAPGCAVALWYLYGQFATFGTADPYVWIRARGFLLTSLSISAAHVILLGVPAYLLLRWCNALRWWTALLCGLVLGALPVVVLVFPLRFAQSTMAEMVAGFSTMIDGSPPFIDWFQYLGVILFFGGCGALSAAGFWTVWGARSSSSFLKSHSADRPNREHA